MENNKDYSKRELDGIHKNISDTLIRIEQQTIKINGRVSGLEKWKSYITGGLAVITLMLVPILIWSLTQMIERNNSQAFAEIIRDELKNFEFDEIQINLE